MLKMLVNHSIYNFLNFLWIYRYYQVSVADLWHNRRGQAEFRTTMSRTRFLELMRFLRFDNKCIREERKSKGNFQAILELFEEFNARHKDTWNLDEEVTIDETLKSFKVVANSRSVQDLHFFPCCHWWIWPLRLQNDTTHWLAQERICRSSQRS